MPITFQVTVVPPVEPQIEMTLSGISNFQQVDKQTITVTLPLSKWKELAVQAKAAIDAVIPPQ
jgi:hypothetical protein